MSADTRYAYTLPRSCDECGETQEQGRYVVAHSRDGWWVLDADSWTVLRWAVAEADALAFRDTLLKPQPCRACGELFSYDPNADFCPRCAAENAGEGPCAECGCSNGVHTNHCIADA